MICRATASTVMSPESVQQWRTRREQGPPVDLHFYWEIKTWLGYKGHSMSGSAEISHEGRTEEYKEKDPIEHVTKNAS